MFHKYCLVIFLLVLNIFSAQILLKDSLKIAYVDSLYATMTLDEKLGQLFVVAAYTNKKNNENKLLNLIIKEHIGGVIFMQDNVEKQVDLINLFQNKSKTPLIIGMDAEWGLSMRLKNTFKFPYNMTLGAIENDTLIYLTAKKIAQHCKRIGVNWNFAPVVDVNTNPNNPIIGNRSFGSDVENVSKKALAFIQGLKNENILASAKHFPGHGDTNTDSHKTLPMVPHSFARLDSVELYPYKKLIENNISGIMVAHLDVPSLENKNKPSSLSYSIITELLKQKMGFKGLIITDALNMQGVANSHPPGIVDLEAFKAGNDVLLFSQNVALAKEKLTIALQNNEIPLNRIEESVKKILSYKYEVGLSHYKTITKENVWNDLNDNESKVLNEQLYENAITLVQNKNQTLPLLDVKKTYYYLSLEDNKDKIFLQYAKKYAIIKKISASAISSIPNNSHIIIGLYKNTNSPYSSYKLNATSIQTIESLAKKHIVILVLFTNPYSFKSIKTENISSIIVAYENNEITQKIVAEQLFGAKAIKGKLPVDVNDIFKYNNGIQISKSNKLGYSLPENEGINTIKLNKIEKIVLNAITHKETPGMQVLVASNGNIVYQKSFGFLTYNNKQIVTDSTMYDLASVTKVTSTLPFIMKLYEKKKIQLDVPLVNYWKEAHKTNKENITLQELLTHTSGLKNYIPFYKETLDKGKLKSEYYRDSLKSKYPYFVANHIYSTINSKDSVRDRIISSPLGIKKYKYSDLGFIILQDVVERQFKKPLDELIEQQIASPLFSKTLIYNPLEKFNVTQIAPTEYDTVFRNQLIVGTVHDQTAALMGGVSGHAGLFSSAEDIAKVMQLYLNGGNYGGYTFLNKNTIKYFSQFNDPSKNRRALGFDKQMKVEGPFCECVAEEGFGHTGFTGTMIWIDPKNNLIIIILSNRVYPNANSNKLQKNKTRQRIQEIVYESLLK